MRKIIDGIIYDTNVAILIADFQVRRWATDSYYWSWRIRVYHTKKNNWFFYSQRPFCPFFWSSGNIEPGSPDEVLELFEENNEVELIQKYFPDKIKEA